MDYSVILTAGGLSTRLGLGIKKEFYTFSNGKSVLSTCAETFLLYFRDNPDKILSNLIITLPEHALAEGEQSFYTGITSDLCKILKIKPSFIHGGDTRQKSVYNALLLLQSSNSSCKTVLIHDAARPYVTIPLIDRVIRITDEKYACVPVIQSTDTQKKIDSDTGCIIDHLERKSIVCVQTPQGFKFPDILKAHQGALLSTKSYTDDSEIWSDYYENDPMKSRVWTCEGENDNKKITFSSDLNDRR